MFEKRKQAPQPSELLLPPGALMCPLTGHICRTDCAWLLNHECAIAYLAKEIYTGVEALSIIANPDAQRGQANGNDMPPGAVVVQQAAAQPDK